MKYLVKFFVVTFLVLISTHAVAEQKLVYLDLKFVLNSSKAGKEAQDFLQKTFKTNQKKYADLEVELKKEENDLLANKTTLSKEDYKSKSDELRKNVVEYLKDRRSSLDKITSQRAEARQTLLKTLDPIIQEYIQENKISIILDKKNILGGDQGIDITDIIIEKLNKKLPSLNLK